MNAFVLTLSIYFVAETIVSLVRAPKMPTRENRLAKYLEGVIYFGIAVWGANVLGYFN